jgi:hypothetical protein
MNKPARREGFVSNEPAEPAAPPALELPVDPPVEENKEAWPVKVKLMHKPVRNTKGESVNELSFREPSGGDINRYGMPCHVDQYGEVVIVERKMTVMMAALSGIHQPFIEMMDPRDWCSCAYRLRGFFLPDPAAW